MGVEIAQVCISGLLHSHTYEWKSMIRFCYQNESQLNDVLEHRNTQSQYISGLNSLRGNLLNSERSRWRRYSYGTPETHAVMCPEPCQLCFVGLAVVDWMYTHLLYRWLSFHSSLFVVGCGSHELLYAVGKQTDTTVWCGLVLPRSQHAF